MAFSMDKPVWVLTYLHDWDPPREDGTQPYYPEVHTYCFDTEAAAVEYWKQHPSKDKYHVHKTWLQESEMKSGEQKVIYWVMYEERAKVKVTTWPEPEQWDWGLRTVQHFGTTDLPTAIEARDRFQQDVNAKRHFLQSELSGPESHHLTETWIEIEHRCRLENPSVTIPSITVADLGASKE